MAGKSFKMLSAPTFKSQVKLPRIGDDPLEVSFTFKVMDRKTLAKTFDGWKAQAIDMYTKMEADAKEGTPWTLEQIAEYEIPMQTAQLKEVVTAWGFSDAFTDENIEELVASSVSVTDVIIEAYNEGYARARRGN